MNDQSPILLAVNGTLMRGLALNPNLVAAGATFVRETTTAATYRLWSIDDRHPAMMRVARWRRGDCGGDLVGPGGGARDDSR